MRATYILVFKDLRVMVNDGMADLYILYKHPI